MAFFLTGALLGAAAVDASSRRDQMYYNNNISNAQAQAAQAEGTL